MYPECFLYGGISRWTLNHADIYGVTRGRRNDTERYIQRQQQQHTQMCKKNRTQAMEAILQLARVLAVYNARTKLMLMVWCWCLSLLNSLYPFGRNVTRLTMFFFSLFLYLIPFNWLYASGTIKSSHSSAWYAFIGASNNAHTRVYYSKMFACIHTHTFLCCDVCLHVCVCILTAVQGYKGIWAKQRPFGVKLLPYKKDSLHLGLLLYTYIKVVSCYTGYII